MTGHPHSPATAADPGGGSSAARLIGTLGGVGALAGLLIVVAYYATRPRIEAHKAEVLAAAIEEVLGDPVRYDTLYLSGDSLSPIAPAGVLPGSREAVFLGYRADSSVIGFAVVGEEPGFSDVVRLIFGYDPRNGRLLGMKILEEKETPGLGERIESDTGFTSGFSGVHTPLTGVKEGRAKDSTGVDMITGATISSRTVIRAINQALERIGPALAARLPKGAS